MPRLGEPNSISSCLSQSAAKRSAASTSSRLNCGYSRTSSSGVAPSPSSSRMSSTVMRVPSIVGLPRMIAGSETSR